MKKLLVCILAVAFLAGCGADTGDEKTLRIGASTTPHAEIIKHIQPVLEEAGYKVEITEFTDYNTPNESLVNGNLDANFIQHKPYMEDWAVKAKQKNKITSIFAVHFEPIGIYSVKHTTLGELVDGAKIAIPNDPTNGGRALKLLADNGIITLKKGKGVDAVKKDITSYTKKVEIIEMAPENCAKTIGDVDFAVVNGNNALLAKINEHVITKEANDSEAAKKHANIIAVQPEHKNDKKIKALVDALNTDDVKDFINEKYEGIVVPLVPSK